MAKKNTEPLIYAGNVYSFPVENKFGLVQIVDNPGDYELYIIVFERLYTREEIDINDLENEKILFAGITQDGRIYNDLWRYEGRNTEYIKKVRFFYYKMGLDYKEGELYNYNEEYLRKTTKEEFKQLDYRTAHSSVGFEKSLKSYHGIDFLDYEYDDMLYENVLKSIEIVEGKQNKLKFWK
jgi:Immunity protein 26